MVLVLCKDHNIDKEQNVGVIVGRTGPRRVCWGVCRGLPVKLGLKAWKCSDGTMRRCGDGARRENETEDTGRRGYRTTGRRHDMA